MVGDCATHRDLPLHSIALEARRGRPNMEHMMALLDLADDLGLGHLFTD